MAHVFKEADNVLVLRLKLCVLLSIEIELNAFRYTRAPSLFRLLALQKGKHRLMGYQCGWPMNNLRTN